MPRVTTPNIGPGQRRLRFMIGVAAILIGASSLATFVVLGAPRAIRLTLFLPFWVGGLGVLQAREKT